MIQHLNKLLLRSKCGEKTAHVHIYFHETVMSKAYQ